MQTTITQCPKCGCTELGIGVQQANGYMLLKNKIAFGSNVEHVVCTQCGFLIESYVTKPTKFKGTM